MSTQDDKKKDGPAGRLWCALRTPSLKYSSGGILLAGIVAGIIFWGGFNTFMEHTNTLGFCTSCHEMDQLVYPEYQKSVHYKNRTGVRVICSDCHVPKAWWPKLMRKIKASGELYHKLVGTIDTPQKFEARRLVLAERVWASMAASDSRECRNCHAFQAMDFSKQERRPQDKHPEARDAGKTCIECHKGIAHSLPEGYDEDDDD